MRFFLLFFFFTERREEIHFDRQQFWSRLASLYRSSFGDRADQFGRTIVRIELLNRWLNRSWKCRVMKRTGETRETDVRSSLRQPATYISSPTLPASCLLPPLSLSLSLPGRRGGRGLKAPWDNIGEQACAFAKLRARRPERIGTSEHADACWCARDSSVPRFRGIDRLPHTQTHTHTRTHRSRHVCANTPATMAQTHPRIQPPR